MAIFRYDFRPVNIGGGQCAFYERKANNPLEQYVPECFARVCYNRFFRSLNLSDGERDYFLRYCPATQLLTLKICTK